MKHFISRIILILSAVVFLLCISSLPPGTKESLVKIRHDQAIARYEYQYYESVIQNPSIVQSLYTIPSTVDKNVLIAIMWVESRFDPKAINKNIKRGKVVSTDSGLFQLNSKVYADIPIQTLLTIESNMIKGIAHIEQDIDWANGDMVRALMAYNGGRSRVALDKPTSKQKKYATLVLQKAAEFNTQKIQYVRHREQQEGLHDKKF